MVYQKGHKHSEETKRKIGLAHKGKIVGIKTRQILSKSRMGKNNPNYGNHLSLDMRQKLSNEKYAERNPNWKGDDIKDVEAIHTWIRRRVTEPELCPCCGEKRKLTLANLNNHCYRRRIEDYMWLCYRCHKNYDNIMRRYHNGL